MAKASFRYICQQCGGVHMRWQGQCHECQAWNSLVQESVGGSYSVIKKRSKSSHKIEPEALSGVEQDPQRYSVGIGEFDRVLGGGLVPGSAVLIGGDPGIGKSTLLLQVSALLSVNYETVYFSGEESIAQIRMRARRLGVADSVMGLAAESQVEAICDYIRGSKVRIVVIDSIQTMYVSQLDNAPGSVGQVRAAAHEIIKCAKERDVTVLLVGHVTKDGVLAGPRVLEHMVDAVLYFEGERTHPFRILRGVKNRYATTDEIGVFDMTGDGLSEVINPSELFLSDRHEGIAGSVVFAGMEGTRPMLVEVQALVSPSYLPSPRRAVVGCDSARLAMVLAVLERSTTAKFGGYDVYVNVVGGLKIVEPAADLAIATAILSAISDEALDSGCVIFGELGLSGEIRRVNLAELRLREAQKLGFTQALTPQLKDSEMQTHNKLAIKTIQNTKNLACLFPSLGSKPKHKPNHQKP